MAGLQFCCQSLQRSYILLEFDSYTRSKHNFIIIVRALINLDFLIERRAPNYSVFDLQKSVADNRQISLV